MYSVCVQYVIDTVVYSLVQKIYYLYMSMLSLAVADLEGFLWILLKPLLNQKKPFSIFIHSNRSKFIPGNIRYICKTAQVHFTNT